MKIVKWISAVGLALSFILLATTFIASCSSSKESAEVEPFTAPIKVKAYTQPDTKVIVADVGSGCVMITQTGTITYMKGRNVEEDFLEVHSTPELGALGIKKFEYGTKFITYDPKPGILTFYGGLPSPEDDFIRND